MSSDVFKRRIRSVFKIIPNPALNFCHDILFGVYIYTWPKFEALELCRGQTTEK